MSRIILAIIVIGFSIGHTIYSHNKTFNKDGYGYSSKLSSTDFSNYITLQEALQNNAPRYGTNPSLYEIYFYNDSHEKYDLINMMSSALGRLPDTQQNKNVSTAASVLRLVATAHSEKSYELARDKMLELSTQIEDSTSSIFYRLDVNKYFANPEALLQRKQQKQRELEAEYKKS